MSKNEQSNTSQPLYRRRWPALWALGAGVLMGTLDLSIVNVALPTLVKEMRTDLVTVQWVIIIYGLIITCLMLIMGRLGDMLGKRKVFCWGMGLFTLGSLSCGLSPNIHILIVSRAFQAGGSVMMQALVAAMVTALFPAGERGRALGAMGAVVSIGLALGPPWGALLSGWQAGISSFSSISRLVWRLYLL